MYKSPDGQIVDVIPQRWVYNGLSYELAGSFRLAKRAGWTEVTLTAEEEQAIIDAKLLEEAKPIFDKPGCREAVGRVIARAMAIQASGVSIDEWTFQSISDRIAAKSATLTLEEKFNLQQQGSALLSDWMLILYYCDSNFDKADRLWDAFCTLYQTP